MSLNGKTIIVTGVASGIGAETARELKLQGARVIGLDRHETDENVDQFVAIDLSSADSISNAIEQIPEGANGLCNIAGLPPTVPAETVMTVNVLGLQALTEGLIPKLSDGSSIVNIASLAGGGWPNAVEQVNTFLAQADFDNVADVCAQLDVVDARGYFFSKEVLICWTMANRWTWRDRGIRMNCISPGPVDTPILPDFLETLGERAEEDQRIMDRPGTPTDVAPVVAFLISDASAWIRGTNIPCDGGMNAHIACEMNGIKAN